MKTIKDWARMKPEMINSDEWVRTIRLPGQVEKHYLDSQKKVYAKDVITYHTNGKTKSHRYYLHGKISVENLYAGSIWTQNIFDNETGALEEVRIYEGDKLKDNKIYNKKGELETTNPLK